MRNELVYFIGQNSSVLSALDQLRNDKLVHAILIKGQVGSGKWTLAKAMAKYLLCLSDTEEKPCNQCSSCKQVETLSNPDLIILQKGEPLSSDTKKGASSISVDDVREMIRLISAHAFEGDRKVVIIRHAEDLTIAAQNSLLKVLEEPPSGVFFLLTSSRSDMLLPTIISRCRDVHIDPWHSETILKILKEKGISNDLAEKSAEYAHGSVGRALMIANDEKYWMFRSEVIQDFFTVKDRSEILKISSKWKDRKSEANALFEMIEDCFHRIIMINTLNYAEDSDRMLSADPWLKQFSGKTYENYIKLTDGLILAKEMVYSSVNFQAIIEKLLMSIMEVIN